MKNVVLTLLITAVFLTGYFLGRHKRARIEPVISKRTAFMGLTSVTVDYGSKRVIQFWVPYGFSGSDSGEDFVYFRREVIDSGDELKNIRAAINSLLTAKSENALPVYSMIPGGKIKDIALSDSKLLIDFSKEFSPGGGSLAMRQARLAVEEVARQFYSVKEVEMTVEGRSEALEP